MKPLVKVFSSNWRGLGGETEDGRGLILDFRFRENLHLFHGAKLAVFMAILLHSDGEYRSFPGYDLLEKETGYQRDTIARTLGALCEMRVDGAPLLLRYRERDDSGKFTGSNRYIVFPTEAEIAEYGSPESENRTVDSPESDYPTMENPTLVKSDSKLNHSIKLNQLKGDAEKLAAESAERVQARRRSTAAALERGLQKHIGIEALVVRTFRISPNWNTKTSRDWVAWYKDLPTGQTLEGFARWWYSTDWRGKRGEPPTLQLIRELWPQAYAPSTGEEVKQVSLDAVRARMANIVAAEQAAAD